jgi:glyoxylase-like metal-dependent hydrolase (beta-lactamase superfamily II)
MALDFNTAFEPAYGEAIEVAPDVLRLTVNNPSAFTFHGTNSYIVGRDTLAVIDPGPINEAHLDALLKAINGRPVSHIFVSHTHIDHSPLTERLKRETGAITLAEGPHRAARPLRLGEINPLDASGDMEFQPDRLLADGELVECDGFALRAIHTPGHTSSLPTMSWPGPRRSLRRLMARWRST